MPESSRFLVELEPLAASSLASIEGGWRAVGARGVCSPYLTFGWLQSWVNAYRPRRLHGLRVVDPVLGTVAVGLIEELSLGRLRFAGAPVSPVRGLLALPGNEEDAWRAFGEFICGSDSGFTSFLADGIDRRLCLLPRAVQTPLPWVSMELPGSFDAYMGSLSAGLRRNFRRKLRLVERAGATVSTLGSDASPDGLKAFVRLHQARTKAKGESHPNVDERLVQLLARLDGERSPELRLTTLEQDGRTLGVGLQLDHGGESWFYNVGFDPAAARLSPGIVLRLMAIREAIERGAHRCDFGPGDLRYKRDLGGERHDRFRIEAASHSPLGELQRIGSLSRRRARESEWARSRWAAGRRIIDRVRTDAQGLSRR